NLRGAISWQVIYFLLWSPITVGVWHVTAGWLPERFGGWLRLLMAHLPIVTVVAAIHSLTLTFFSQVFVHEGSRPGMGTSFQDRFLDQLRGEVVAKLLVYTGVAATGAAITLYQRYRDRELAAARLETELTTARLQALRGNLQPHFLFNSLHSIAALAR